jgi:hypothetical protein
MAQYPQLMNSGGSVVFQGSGYSDPQCQQPDIIVVAKGGGQFHRSHRDLVTSAPDRLAPGSASTR